MVRICKHVKNIPDWKSAFNRSGIISSETNLLLLERVLSLILTFSHISIHRVLIQS